MSDDEFFVIACTRASQRNPEFVGSAKLLPLDIHGALVGTDRFAHVVFSFSGAVRTERTNFHFVAPRVFTFASDEGRWLIYTCWLAPLVVDDWWRSVSPILQTNRTR